MLSESSYYEVGLGSAEAISVVATGWEVHCLSGRLWITEEGGTDIWLQAGESARLTRRGRTVIEASGVAALRMAAPPAIWPRRFWHALAWLSVLGRLVRALPRPTVPQRFDAGWSH